MKIYGWIVVQVLEVSTSGVLVRVSETEFDGGTGISKFPHLIGQGMRFRSNEVSFSKIVRGGRGDQYTVLFERSEKKIPICKDVEYALLIVCEHGGGFPRIIKCGFKEDLHKALGKSSNVQKVENPSLLLKRVIPESLIKKRRAI